MRAVDFYRLVFQLLRQTRHVADSSTQAVGSLIAAGVCLEPCRAHAIRVAGHCRLSREASTDAMGNTIHILLWQRRCTAPPSATFSCRLGAIIDHGAQGQSAILPIFVVPVMSTLADELGKAVPKLRPSVFLLGGFSKA